MQRDKDSALSLGLESLIPEKRSRRDDTGMALIARILSSIETALANKVTYIQISEELKIHGYILQPETIRKYVRRARRKQRGTPLEPSVSNPSKSKPLDRKTSSASGDDDKNGEVQLTNYPSLVSKPKSTKED